MEITADDREELDRINKNFEDIYAYIQRYIVSLNNLAPNCNIKNLGLYCGNKVRSLFRRFKECNVYYPASMINNALEIYLIGEVDSALHLFNNLQQKIEFETYECNASKKEIETYINTSYEIEKYRNICDSVCEIDLDRDICRILNLILDESTENGEKINDLIDLYNDELELLCVEERLEYRDIDEFIQKQKERKGNLQSVSDKIVEDINKKELERQKIKGKKNKV